MEKDEYNFNIDVQKIYKKYENQIGRQLLCIQWSF